MTLFYSLFRDDPHVVKVPSGAQLFREGDPADFMFVLTIGTARILVGQREVEQLAPGAIVGEMALVDSVPRSATVEALTDCEFVSVDQKRFKFLVAETPWFALGVMKVLANRLRNTDHMIA